MYSNGLTLAWHELALWRGDRCLQSGLSGQLGSGAAITLRGPNGCGKTTMIQTLCGLSEPEAGEVMWQGVPIRQQRSIYYSQLAYGGHRSGLKDDLTARENLQFENRLNGGTGDIETILDNLELLRCADLPVRNLSAGQKRRAMLARVLGSMKSFWVLDEPFTHLDRNGRDWLSSRFNAHLEQGGMLLLAAHQETGLRAERETIIEFSGSMS